MFHTECLIKPKHYICCEANPALVLGRSQCSIADKYNYAVRQFGYCVQRGMQSVLEVREKVLDNLSCL